MAEKNSIRTIFQKLGSITNDPIARKEIVVDNTHRSVYSPSQKDIFTTRDRIEYEAKKLEAQQSKMLSRQWTNVNQSLFQQSIQYETTRMASYIDFEAMEYYPETAAALDIFAEECCTLNNDGKILNIYSSSPRVKESLEDLFINRLDFHANAFPWIRNLCKYGDNFLLLNLKAGEGVLGARQMPNLEIERREGDLFSSLSIRNNLLTNTGENKTKEDKEETTFYWKTKDVEFKSWQIAHFRLFGRDFALPYGTSLLEKTRRIWRLLLMAEDSMLAYRVQRSSERYVFKINVGNIDPQDVEAYVDKIANNYKRKQLIDPSTGQIDLRANVIAQNEDIFVPIRTDNSTSPIELLQGGQNTGVIDDIKFLHNKLLVALEIPDTFLGFVSQVGEGQNLSLLDIRFGKKINRIQQCFLMELNKIAIVHLALLGLEDELNNFTLTLNNPSTQAKMLEIENLAQKLIAYKSAVEVNGDGFQAMSHTRAQREILGRNDDEIKQDLLEQRIEKAAAAELSVTQQIIKHTGFYDKVDNIYANKEMLAKYNSGELQSEEEGGPQGGVGCGGSLGGGSLSLGSEGGGPEGVNPEEQNPEEQAGQPVEVNVGGNNEEKPGEENKSNEAKPKPGENAQETIKRLGKLLVEKQLNLYQEQANKLNKRLSLYYDKENNYMGTFFDRMTKAIDKKQEVQQPIKYTEKSLRLNEQTESLLKNIEKTLLKD